MKDKIGLFPKGPDLLRRIPDVSRHIALPDMTTEDRIGIFASKVFSIGHTQERCIAIEKTVLYYVLSARHLVQPSALDDFAKAALARRELGDDVLRYSHLFDPATRIGLDFWSDHRVELDSLDGMELRLVD